MRQDGETIVAPATPPGRGGIAVVRLSGPRSVEIVGSLLRHPVELRPRVATLTQLSLPGRGNGVGDEAVTTYFPPAASYTGEAVVEIATHGSPVIVRAVVDATIAAGARLARPGEFTLLAFLNGRLDLTQAEAVRDLVEATTERQARMAYDQLRGTLGGRVQALSDRLFDLEARLEASVDFPEEGYHFVDREVVVSEVKRALDDVRSLLVEERVGRAVREGVAVAIVGPPNAGKSTLFNRLVRRDRAIVTDTPGTTRDVISERLDVGGLCVDLADTAGLRWTENAVELEGVRRAVDARDAADLVLFVVDGSQPPTSDSLDALAQLRGREFLLLLNKSDTGRHDEWLAVASEMRISPIAISALIGFGVEEVETRLLADFGIGAASAEDPQLSNSRHAALLHEAEAILSRLSEALVGSHQLPEELVLAELRATRGSLDEVTGKRTTEELLESIFSMFCIGK